LDWQSGAITPFEGIFSGDTPVNSPVPASGTCPNLPPVPNCLNLPFKLGCLYYKFLSLWWGLHFSDATVEKSQYGNRVYVTAEANNLDRYYIHIDSNTWNSASRFILSGFKEGAEMIVIISAPVAGQVVFGDNDWPTDPNFPGKTAFVVLPSTYAVPIQPSVLIESNSEWVGHIIAPFSAVTQESCALVTGNLVGHSVELGGIVNRPFCDPIGKTHYVNCGKPTDYPDIQEALDNNNVTAGDTIVVCPGRYQPFKVYKYGITIVGQNNRKDQSAPSDVPGSRVESFGVIINNYLPSSDPVSAVEIFADHVTLRDLTIMSTDSNGVLIHAADSTVLDHLTVLVTANGCSTKFGIQGVSLPNIYLNCTLQNEPDNTYISNTEIVMEGSSACSAIDFAGSDADSKFNGLYIDNVRALAGNGCSSSNFMSITFTAMEPVPCEFGFASPLNLVVTLPQPIWNVLPPLVLVCCWVMLAMQTSTHHCSRTLVFLAFSHWTGMMLISRTTISLLSGTVCLWLISDMLMFQTTHARPLDHGVSK
jgi:hypothetical protein